MTASAVAGVLLCWNAWLLGVFLSRFLVGPAVLSNATRQYLAEATFSFPVLLGNWATFLSAAVALAGLAAAAGFAGARVRRLLGRRPDAQLSLALGFGVLGTFVLGAGLAGIIVRPSVPAATALLAIPALGLLRRRAGVAAALRANLPGLPPLSVAGTAVLGAAVVVAAAGVLNIEMGWDALTYHLRLPSFYAYRHKVYDVWHHYCSSFPSLVEMLYLACQLAHGDTLARMLNALFGVMLLGCLPRLARAAGLPPAGFLPQGLAAAVVVGSPLFLLLLIRAYIDPGFAWFIVLGLSELLAWRRGSAAAAVTGGLLAGCGLASKYVGALALPAFLAAAAARPRARPFLRPAAVWCLAALAPLAPWLAKNWLFKANPVSPLLGGLFGTHEVIPGDVTPLFSLEHPLRTLAATMPDRVAALVVNHGRIDGPLAVTVAGLLPLVLLGGPPPRARPLYAFLLAYLAGWLVLSPDSRFFLPALPVFAVVAAGAFTRLAAEAPRWTTLGMRVVVEAQLAAGALYAASIIWVFFDPVGMPLGLASTEQRLQQGLPPAPYTYYMKSHINAHVPAGERVWYLSHPFTYYVERECVADFHFGTSQFTRLARVAPTAEAMAKRFRQLGYRWLLSTGVNAAQYSGNPGYFAVPAGVPAELKRLLATRAGTEWQTEIFTLYRLGPVRPAHAVPALPVFEALHWQRADEDLSAGRADEALRAYLDPPPLLADVGSTFLRQGDALMTIGNAARAAEAFRRALALGCDQPRVRSGLAAALQRLGRSAEALPHSEAAWRQSPLSAYAAAGLALNYNNVGRSADAQRMILEAIRIRPDEPEYRALAERLGAGR